ncbi:MAG TPA: cytochrome c maturation protein CcmE [Sedimenticola thiotaurini]|uniref:Cytochrome c-type biogenesis protein CcmE n=1 Tax=Sedimenticola thiotaurini TaxID=1543721 RepID=A0A831W8P6_9GAMM|nr:cytochrome c maturation protein CcmE [Sedimenticola thiotaurini]
MKARHKRLGFLLAGLVGLGVATWLVLNALDSNLSYFFSPTEVAQNKAPADHVFRLGGLVESGSLQRGREMTVRFVVTDNANKVKVEYTGILPDLFQEGQGVIAQGRLGPDGVFVADEVLAKHDENYMPPEVADALKKGHEEGVAGMQKL